MKQQRQEGVLVEKKVLSESQKKVLRAYVLKKRRKDQEDKSHSTVSDKIKQSTTVDSSTTTGTNGGEALCGANDSNGGGTTGKGKDDSLEDVTEQLKSLKEKLEGLKKEKHQLFQELKKVLHEEDEKKQQQQLQQQIEQQKMFQSDADKMASPYHHTEGSLSYRGDPRLGKVTMKHQSWSSSYGEGPPASKVPRSISDMPHYNPLQPLAPYGISEQDTNKYATPPYMQQRVPPQGHMVRPQSMGPGYHMQYSGGHYGGYSTSGQYGSAQPPYQGVPPPGGYVQSPGPLPPPPDVMSGQMYRPPHQQQYTSQGMPPSHEFPSHFTFEPHQPSRYIMRGQRPPHIKMTPFSPQRDQGSPSHSPLPIGERMRYLRTK